MANFGIGLGAFLNGVANGAQVYSSIQDAMSKKELRDIQISKLKDDEADRQEYRSILRGGAQQPTVTTGSDQAGNPTYSVGGQSYPSQEEAQKAADAQIGGFLDNWKKTVAPKLQQFWLKNGDIEKAQNFDKWISDSNVQAGMKSWANMARAYQLGDRPNFLKHLNATLTQTGYYDGEVQPIGATEKTNDKGQLIGYTVNFRDKSTGKESSQDFDSDDIQRMAVVGLSPEQLYSQGMNELAAARKARADAAKTKGEREWEMTKLGVQQQNTLESQSNQSQLRRAEKAEEKLLGIGDAAKDPLAKAKATTDWLRQQGYSEEYIQKNAPAIVGIQNQNKPRSSRIEDFIKLKTENDRNFSKLPLSQQIEQANSYIDTVDKASNGNIDQPSSVPAQSTQTMPQGRRLFWDNNTKSMIER